MVTTARLWRWPTARSSRARPSAPAGDRGRGGLQHLDVRLPGDPHRPVVRRADRHHGVPADRQRGHQRRRRGVRPAARGGAGGARSCSRALQLARHGDARRRTSRAGRWAASRASTPGRLVRHLRTHGAQMGVISTESVSAKALVERAEGAPAWRAWTSRPASPPPRPYEWTQCTPGVPRRRAAAQAPERASTWWRSTTASSGRCCSTSCDVGLPRDGGAGRDQRRRRSSRASPTACSSPTAPATRRR